MKNSSFLKQKYLSILTQNRKVSKYILYYRHTFVVFMPILIFHILQCINFSYIKYFRLFLITKISLEIKFYKHSSSLLLSDIFDNLFREWVKKKYFLLMKIILQRCYKNLSKNSHFIPILQKKKLQRRGIFYYKIAKTKNALAEVPIIFIH